MDREPTRIQKNQGHLDKDSVLAILREHEAELKAAGLLHLRLFGSVAWGDNNLGPDVDLLFDCDDSQCLRVYGFEDRVTEMLGTKAHVSSAKFIKPKILERVLPETVDVF